MSVGYRLIIQHISYSWQCVLIAGPFLLLGALLAGNWLGNRIETAAVNRASSLAGLYAEGVLAAQASRWLDLLGSPQQLQLVLDEFFVQGPLRRKVVRFKLWGVDGRILYSSDHEQTGRIYPMSGPLTRAFEGQISARISPLDQADNLPERSQWPQLLEVYIPLRAGEDDAVAAVAEFYHTTEPLNRDIRDAQRQGWWVVAALCVVLFLLLGSVVRRADGKILRQQGDLRSQLEDLRAALSENERMRCELREAAARSAAYSEDALRRIAADLHDGPAQKIAYAAMHLDEPASPGRSAREVLQQALLELRQIASGMSVPGLDGLSLAQTVERAIREVERQSGSRVSAQITGLSVEVPVAVKIAAYRFVQEALNNAMRHAPNAPPRLRACADGEQFSITVEDEGDGFDPRDANVSGRLGLAFLRERIRLIGGHLELRAAPGQGTLIRMGLPFNPKETVA